VLQKDENIGGADVTRPNEPNVVYDLWEGAGPVGKRSVARDGAASQVHRRRISWKAAADRLPNNGDLTQANLAIAPTNSSGCNAAVRGRRHVLLEVRMTG